jgi:parallel beta-helix repeat protein
MPVSTRPTVAALAILLFAGTPAAAATYYVSPNGADTNSCATAQTNTNGRQRRTIAAGVACLAAGDTLYIRGGTYTGSNNVIDSQRFVVRSGTSWSNAITIAGYPSETVTIRPSAPYSGIHLTTGAPAYLIFKDLIVDMVDVGPGVDGVYLSNGAHHNRFQRLEVKNSGGNGFAFSDNNGNSPFNEVIDCDIHHNGAMTGSNTGYGFYVFTSDNLIEGNRIYSNNGYGIHLYDNAGPQNVNRNVVRNNRIYDNGTGGGSNFGIVVAWGADNLIYNNLIYRNRGGILVYSKSANTSVFNNTVYKNGPSPGIALQYYASAPTVRNNIVYANGSNVEDYGGTGTSRIDHNVTTEPRFVDADAADFRLQPGSVAEDAGTTVTNVPADYAGVTRPQGSAYDIGAYERQQSGKSVPSAPRKLRIVSH